MGSDCFYKTDTRLIYWQGEILDESKGERDDARVRF